MTQFQQPNQISFTLPAWLEAYSQTYHASRDMSKRVDFVLEAAIKHIEEGTGGPFAAAVFESDTGALVSLGLNLVPSAQVSCLHAEIVALSLAQQKLGTYNLANNNLPSLELITSTEPCAMCLGAIPWSGISTVICCATGEDACAIGFDEGDKPNDWKASLTTRNIRLVTEQSRDKAKTVLTYYLEKNGELYNSKQNIL